MSLHAAAQHLAAQGRGDDKVLIHMTPKEVQGLQELAMAHGGSLTINPHTGLPEAGFLSSILPMVVGAGLMAATGGAAAPAVMGAGAAGAGAAGAGLFGLGMPATIGLGVGGIEALRTGNLGKGLMAGLGAYGGAGLLGGLAGMGAASPELVAQALGTPAATGAGSQAAMLAAQNAGFGQAGLESLAESAGVAQGASPAATPSMLSQATAGLKELANDPMKGIPNLWTNLGKDTKERALTTAALAAPALVSDGELSMQPTGSGPNPYKYSYDPGITTPTPAPDVPGYGSLNQNFGREQRYFSPRYMDISPTAQTPSTVTQMPIQMAEGGLPVEQMSDANSVGANTGFPMADIAHGAYATPYQQPISRNVVTGPQDVMTDPFSGVPRMAEGGLGDYSDGGRLLRGPGDGVSDSIPAVIGNKRPARLADGEFVVPARIVSELGNGSTESGARKLYAMMDRVQKSRGKTVGKNRIAADSRADKYLPA